MLSVEWESPEAKELKEPMVRWCDGYMKFLTRNNNLDSITPSEFRKLLEQRGMANTIAPESFFLPEDWTEILKKNLATDGILIKQAKKFEQIEWTKDRVILRLRKESLEADFVIFCDCNTWAKGLAEFWKQNTSTIVPDTQNHIRDSIEMDPTLFSSLSGFKHLGSLCSMLNALSPSLSRRIHLVERKCRSFQRAILESN